MEVASAKGNTRPFGPLIIKKRVNVEARPGRGLQVIDPSEPTLTQPLAKVQPVDQLEPFWPKILPNLVNPRATPHENNERRRGQQRDVRLGVMSPNSSKRSSGLHQITQRPVTDNKNFFGRHSRAATNGRHPWCAGTSTP